MSVPTEEVRRGFIEELHKIIKAGMAALEGTGELTITSALSWGDDVDYSVVREIMPNGHRLMGVKIDGSARS